MILSQLLLPSSVQRDLARVIDIVKQTCRSQYPAVEQILTYVANTDGKNLRALLVILLAKGVAYEGEKHTIVAAAIEIMHLASLLHDDVIDEETVRRGKASAYQKWGSKASVLSGDLLYASAFEKIASLSINPLNRAFAETTKHLVIGELLQIDTCWERSDKEKRYFDIIGLKTASIFSLCAKATAYVSGVTNQQQANRWGQYAWHLGIAFQIMDDVLDFTSSKSGKTQGKDLLEGKITLPMLLALPHLSAHEKDALKTQQTASIAPVSAALERVGAFAHAKTIAAEHCQAAQTLQKQLFASNHNNFITLLNQIPQIILGQ